VASPLITDIVVAVREEESNGWKRCCARRGPRAVGLSARGGGAEHAAGIGGEWLAALDPDTDVVAVHDAVRPFVDLETIRR